ncbi:MAG: HD-GYP domain-containing protein, partial [Thermoleophilia bacterium]|nr:HD-GYP domain-containing protein [Thermoleophilia bacterium]
RDLSDAELSGDDLNNLNSRLEGAGFQTIRVLAKAVDVRDQYPEHDMNNLSSVATSVARQLSFTPEQIEALILATKLHDIGKIGIPKKILQKTDHLLPEELDILRQHPQMGEQILQEANTVKDLITAVLYHHERWDGKGYPEGLRGEEIPLMARIVGILDSYRAMRSERPYSQALSVNEAISELRKAAGTQFDPKLVDLFVKQLTEEEGKQLRQTG